MSAAVRIIPTQLMVEQAWEEYAETARAIIAEPSLAVDRDHMERFARTQRRFIDLFLQWDVNR